MTMSQTPPPDASAPTAIAEDTPQRESREEAPSENLLEEGFVISERYRIEKRIGEGGMGSVYRAKHITMNTDVAIKVLHRSLAKEEEFAMRFQREAQAASLIKHPNICAATDFGKLPDGSFYLVMEYLAGETLEELMRREVLVPLQETLQIAEQIASVLHEAHEHGIVHRDLKPENIMLVMRAGQAGVVKVMDFGIASVRDGERLAPETRITRAGIAYGTPAYMSPEQVAGQTDIDGRADLYSLGIMLYEMLTGSHPFDAQNAAAMMAQHLTTLPPAPSLKAPSVKIPPALEELVLRLLAKEPLDRPQSAAETKEALHQLAAAQTLQQSMVHGTIIPPEALAPTQAQSSIPSNPQLTALLPIIHQHRKGLLAAVTLFGLCAVAGLFFIALAVTQPPPDPLDEPPIEVDASSPPEEVQLSLEQSRQRFVLNTEGLNALVVQMAAGEQEEALKKLEEFEEEKVKESPHYAYYMGLGHDGLSKPEEAMDFYLEAIRKDARYIQDPQIGDRLVNLALSRNKSQQEKYEKSIEEFPEMFKALAVPLAEVATNPDANRSTRKRAAALIKDNEELAAQLKPWRRALISLENESGCDERGAAIKALAETGHPRAYKALQRWSDKPTKGCSGRSLRSKLAKDQDCYACLRKDLKEALARFPEEEKEEKAPEDTKKQKDGTKR